MRHFTILPRVASLPLWQQGVLLQEDPSINPSLHLEKLRHWEPGKEQDGPGCGIC